MTEITKDIIINNRYTPVNRIGIGSCSETWLVTDNITRNKAVLKCYYSPDSATADMIVERFTSIIDLRYNAIITPRIVDMYGDRPFTVTRIFHNGSLDRVIGRIDEEALWRCILQVSTALEYLHSLPVPILHQNIKPTNILIDDYGSFMLSGFGIGNQLKHQIMDRYGHTASQGDIAYMPPEVAQGNNDGIKAGDIWAFGATLYTLVTGQKPFAGRGGAMQNSGAPVPSLNPGWSQDLNQLIQQCLDKEPWNRPTAAQVKAVAQRHNGMGAPAAPAPAAETYNPAPANTVPTPEPFGQPTTIQTPPPTFGSQGMQQIPEPTFGPAASPQPFGQRENPMPQPASMRPWETADDGTRRFDSTKKFNQSRSNRRKESTLEKIINTIEKYRTLLLILILLLGLGIAAMIYLRGKDTEKVPVGPTENNIEQEDAEYNETMDIETMTTVEDNPEETQKQYSQATPPPVTQIKKIPDELPARTSLDKKPDAKSGDATADGSQKSTEAPSNNATRLADALQRNDYNAIITLSDNGYMPATGELAVYYLKNKNYKEADFYGRKAKDGGDKKGAKVVEVLTEMGFYDEM